MHFTVHKIDSNILSENVPPKFWTCSESQIPFHQQMTAGPLPSAAASVPCAYLKGWECVSKRAQFCDKPRISKAIKGFYYLGFFMIKVQQRRSTDSNISLLSRISPSAFLLLPKNMLFFAPNSRRCAVVPKRASGHDWCSCPQSLHCSSLCALVVFRDVLLPTGLLVPKMLSGD